MQLQIDASFHHRVNLSLLGEIRPSLLAPRLTVNGLRQVLAIVRGDT